MGMARKFVALCAAVIIASIYPLLPACAQSLCPGGIGYCWANDAGRPPTPGVGANGYNQSRGALEWWNGTNWVLAVASNCTQSVFYDQ
jgi:hypothetical protein